MIEKVNINEHTNRFKMLLSEITFTWTLINHTNSAVVFTLTLLQSYKGFVITFSAHQVLTLEMEIGFVFKEEIWQK
jgi:hypothetical protein